MGLARPSKMFLTAAFCLSLSLGLKKPAAWLLCWASLYIPSSSRSLCWRDVDDAAAVKPCVFERTSWLEYTQKVLLDCPGCCWLRAVTAPRLLMKVSDEHFVKSSSAEGTILALICGLLSSIWLGNRTETEETVTSNAC